MNGYEPGSLKLKASALPTVPQPLVNMSHGSLWWKPDYLPNLFNLNILVQLKHFGIAWSKDEQYFYCFQNVTAYCYRFDMTIQIDFQITLCLSFSLLYMVFLSLFIILSLSLSLCILFFFSLYFIFLPFSLSLSLSVYILFLPLYILHLSLFLSQFSFIIPTFSRFGFTIPFFYNLLSCYLALAYWFMRLDYLKNFESQKTLMKFDSNPVFYWLWNFTTIGSIEALTLLLNLTYFTFIFSFLFGIFDLLQYSQFRV